MTNKTLFLFFTAIVAVFFADPAFASTNTNAPWESGLTTLQNSLTGPVATGISLIGIVAAGAMLMFGGEISGFLKSIVYLVLVISMIMFGNKILAMLGTSSGAVITSNAQTLVINTQNNSIV